MNNNVARFQIFLHKRQLFFFPAVLVGICLLVMGSYADYLHSRNLEREIRDAAFIRLSLLRANLEGKITSNAQLVQGLAASISVEPDLSVEKFTQLAQYLFKGKGRSQLRNISVAPDLVIRYMYPVEGNEAAIGLNFWEHPQQLESVLRARDSGNLIIAGPVDLVQGGLGFIARIPVFLNNDDAEFEKKAFWGMISAVIDVNKLYQASGLLDFVKEFDISIRGKDALGKAGEVFFGTVQLFEQNPVLLDIYLPNGSWQIAAIPKGGWLVTGNESIIFRLGLILTSILILLPVVLIAKFQQKKRDSEARLEALFVMSPIGIALNDYETGKFIAVNDALLVPTGYTREELLNLTYWDITPKDYAMQEAQQLEHMQITGGFGPYKKEYIHKNGSHYPVLLNGVVIYDASGRKLIWSMVEDITERMQAEQSLRVSQERYQRLVEDIGEKFVIYSYKARTSEITYVTGGMEKVFGLSKDEAIGKSWENIINWLPESRERAHFIITKITEGEIYFSQFEMCFTHPDGNERTILVSCHPATDIDSDLRIEGIVEDIAERKTAELALITARHEAERANKAKSEFLSSMSHELRTPMNAILGFNQLLELEGLDDRHLKYVKGIKSAGIHLLALIDELLDLAKIESGRIDLQLEWIEICTVVEECINLVRIQADGQDIKLTHSGMADKVLYTDRIRFKQIILNLIHNAIKYNRKGGWVHIELKDSDNPEYLKIIVTDSGIGIAANRLTELFQPFSRLDAAGSAIEGTGIGLSLTRRIIEMMGGCIGVESELDCGSTFWFELPVSGEKN